MLSPNKPSVGGEKEAPVETLNQTTTKANKAGLDLGPSLLDIFSKQLAVQGKTTLIHRLVICGQLKQDTPAAKQALGVHYQKFFRSFPQTDADLVTGMLLIFNQTAIQVIESSYKVVRAFLHEMTGDLSLAPTAPVSTDGDNTANDESSQTSTDSTRPKTSLMIPKKPASPVTGQAYLKNIKVLLSNGDAQKRYFPFWASRVVDLRSMEAPADLDPVAWTPDQTSQYLMEPCVNMLSLGFHLSKLQKADLKQALDELHGNYKNLIPRQDLLMALTQSDMVQSVEDWIASYDGYRQFTLESETVWPAPRAIF